MTEELEFKTFLSISLEGFEIFVLNNKNFENLYKQEVKFQNKTNIIHFENLNKFLEENIFKIEKIIGKFIKDIFLIIENPEIFDLNIGIKKKNYETSITKKDLETILTDAKDLFKENYENERIMHMIIVKYVINGKNHFSLEENLSGDYICVEIKFISIPISTVSGIEKILEKYQIKITDFMDRDYVKSFFENDNLELSQMAQKVQNGFNFNEVKLIPKNIKKKGFFEKFFQLFS